MYLQPVSIYGVRYQASSDEPVLHRYPWFPTLKFLSAHRLAGAVARALSRAGSSKTQWTSSEWLSLKEYLQDNMLKDVCEDLFESHINTNLRLPTGRCYYCRRLHRQVLRTDVRRNLSNLFESDKILNKLVLDPALDPPFVRPDVFYNSNLGRLGETDMNITSLSLTSSSKDPELLDSILRKVIHLEEFSMTYDGAKDASVFDLLSQHCSLRKFSIVSKRLGFQSKNCIESFINFLLSQTESIQELTELVSLSGPIGESDYPLQFFESIAQMRRLTVFHWSGSGFINLSRFEVISICVRVKTIVISMDNQKIEMCPFDRWFPELESIRLVLQAFNENIISLEKSQNLSKVSSVAVLSLCFEIDPEPTPLSSSLQLMTLFPNASEVSIKSFHISPPIKDRVAVQRLRNLELRSYNNPILFDNFKIVFESCPNLINCALIFSTVSGYDQEEFVRFLESAKANYQKMKKLNIDLCSPPAGMTGAAICAILCHSNLVQFQTFAKIKFTAEENEELKRVAKCQKLTIVPAFKVGSKLIPCDQGKHELKHTFPAKIIGQ